jgi:hypothetical protein
MLEGYPRDAKADPTKPYVMWAGTPYEHLMLPVKEGEIGIGGTALDRSSPSLHRDQSFQGRRYTWHSQG